MIHAYNENYLTYVCKNIASVFDVAINVLKIPADKVGETFALSEVARKIEAAAPDMLVGRSPAEMLSIITGRDIAVPEVNEDKSPEYWAGFIISKLQWELNVSFKKIFDVIPLSKIIELYNPYHEADESKVITILKERFPEKESKLKSLRIKNGLTQEQLAMISGINVRSIRAYEQGKNELMKAQGDTLYMLAKSLDTTVEDLLIPNY